MRSQKMQSPIDRRRGIPMVGSAMIWIAMSMTANAQYGGAIHPPASLAAMPHLVIEPPPTRHGRPANLSAAGWGDESLLWHDDAAVIDAAATQTAPRNGSVKPHHDWQRAIPSHADRTPSPPPIPQASRAPVWKQPYSYGYFGAQHNRQWSVHHGHQRSHTQWTFR